MMICGNVSSEQEAREIAFIMKLFAVGQRARFLARQIDLDPRYKKGVN